VTVKVDTGDLGWRRRDLDREFFSFIKGIGMQIGLVDPTAHQKLAFNNALAPNETDKQRQISHYYTM
jgi:lactate 2-monooxygenase